MNNILKRTLLPGLMAASLAGITLVPVKPAAADDHILKDVGIGAAAGLITGGIRGHGSVLGNAAKGGLTGAAVNGANGLRSNRHHRNLGQDAAVGAGANALTGAVTGDGKHTVGNAIEGGVIGGAIHVLDK